MQAKRLCCALLAISCLGWGQALAIPLKKEPPLVTQPKKDPAREIFLQTVGLLAGQGLVLGHASLAGIAVQFDKNLLPREKAEQALVEAGRYNDLVLSAFKDRLMGQLSNEERRDLGLLIGFYEVQRDAIAALATYVRGGNQKVREAFEAQQERMTAIIRQISLNAAH